MAKTHIDPDLLRRLARGYLQVARDNDLVKSTTEQVIETRTVKIIIDRDYEELVDDEGNVSYSSERTIEHITVKVGTTSRQETVIAAPAKWLDPEQKMLGTVRS